ncbi:hypothetical protein EVAR_4584_1 [Eumeta japonica]|uniref:Uncharacterized protein n=1 Tax=Eumeta variegata TaxID=151549 RepID=A0A4C1SYV6_EUMVA|nr:hypothetical protein EVAR_4584_1 [Eumeta japonica]
MEVKINLSRQLAQRRSDIRLSEEMSSDSWINDSNDQNDFDDEGFTHVPYATPAARAAPTVMVPSKAPPSTSSWRMRWKTSSQDVHMQTHYRKCSKSITVQDVKMFRNTQETVHV